MYRNNYPSEKYIETSVALWSRNTNEFNHDYIFFVWYGLAALIFVAAKSIKCENTWYMTWTTSSIWNGINYLKICIL